MDLSNQRLQLHLHPHGRTRVACIAQHYSTAFTHMFCTSLAPVARRPEKSSARIVRRDGNVQSSAHHAQHRHGKKKHPFGRQITAHSKPPAFYPRETSNQPSSLTRSRRRSPPVTPGRPCHGARSVRSSHSGPTESQEAEPSPAHPPQQAGETSKGTGRRPPLVARDGSVRPLVDRRLPARRGGHGPGREGRPRPPTRGRPRTPVAADF